MLQVGEEEDGSSILATDMGNIDTALARFWGQIFTKVGRAEDAKNIFLRWAQEILPTHDDFLLSEVQA